ncbi:MAG TPA: GNAT family N-acetyltransferase [Polyangiaceae bacterium]|nr:GNAT family N-acetyltransferase [Polyangiaceae bacterium]
MTVIIRRAEARDLPGIAALAGQLVRQHHDFDALRFMLIPNVERGYAHFFASELSDPDVLLFTAELEGSVVGYAYARLEPRDWNALLDSCGALHDIFVGVGQRRQGVARRLVEAVREGLREKGAPRLVLHTASKNETARRFFAELGFRETMVELTAELPPAADRKPR